MYITEIETDRQTDRQRRGWGDMERNTNAALKVGEERQNRQRKREKKRRMHQTRIYQRARERERQSEGDGDTWREIRTQHTKTEKRETDR